jgi:hypothetical protein
MTTPFTGMAELISITRVQRALGCNALGQSRVRVIDGPAPRVMIDGQIIGAYYKHGLVSTTDLCGSSLSDEDLQSIAK